MFQVPFYKVNISRWNIHKKEVMSKLYKNLDGRIEKHECMTTFFSEMQDLDLNLALFKPFLDFIKSDLDELRKVESMSGGYPMPDVTDIWYQSYTKNQYHQLHNHGSIGWSAIFYATFDKKEHRATRFYGPFNDVVGRTISHEPDVDEGTLIVFPSYLQHEARYSLSDKKRVIISFNMSPYK